MYSYGPPHMAAQKQDDQHEHTFSNYVRIRDVVQKTCLRRWTIGKSGERGSGIYICATSTTWWWWWWWFLIYGDFYKPWKVQFNSTFCKRINCTSTAVGRWVAAFEERRRMTFSETKFIYNNNNNKQGFTPNGTNNEYISVQKRVQGSDRW